MRATSLLRLYPRDWRERYGDEMAAVLDQHHITTHTVLDLALGALDAHLAPQLMCERSVLMVNRLRASAIAVFCAYIAFVVAGMGFQKLTEDEIHAGLLRTDAALSLSFNIIVVTAVVALAAVLAGGLPIAFSALRDALAQRRWDIPLLFAVPPVAFMVFVGYTLLITRVADALGHPGLHTITNGVLSYAWVGLFCVAAIASTGAVALAVRRSNIDVRLLRFARIPAVVTTAAMLVMLLATVAWGLILRADAPAFFNGEHGLRASPTVGSLVVIVVIMLAATLAAMAALARGLTVRQESAVVA